MLTVVNMGKLEFINLKTGFNPNSKLTNQRLLF